MALLLFCITSINAPTIPEVGAGVGGVDSWPSDTLEKKVRKSEQYLTRKKKVDLAYYAEVSKILTFLESLTIKEEEKENKRERNRERERKGKRKKGKGKQR